MRGDSGFKHESAQLCGCDAGANHVCERHRTRTFADYVTEVLDPPDAQPAVDRKLWRKQRPLHSGVLAYFPDALMEVAYVSFLGNEQHNPGEPLHWAKEKSTDHLDCCARHITDHSKEPVDDDGGLHLAKNAWRALAALQIYLEGRKQ